MMPTGLIVGYDPGGNNAHGIARLEVRDGRARSIQTITLESLETVVSFIEQNAASILAFGVDTLTCWSTGSGAWRPADRWLRDHYRAILRSVISPNNLSGAMGINGMAALMAARRMNPDVPITETHPKVLYFHLSGRKHDYENDKATMDATLKSCLGLTAATTTEHEWDAAISALAMLEGLSGRWTLDLHRLPVTEGERLIAPCGMTQYFWPSEKSLG